MFSRKAALLASLVAACAIFAQSPATRPVFDTFEVATIKPTGPDARGRFIRMQTANQFVARNHALKTLVAAAYNLNPRMISGGPEWIDSERYDIDAKAERIAKSEMMQGPMLQALLEDRFKLKIHHGTREIPVYNLTVAKDGSKLQPFKEGSCTPNDFLLNPFPPPLVPGRPDLRAQALYARSREWAQTDDDVLRRRTTAWLAGPQPAFEQVAVVPERLL